MSLVNSTPTFTEQHLVTNGCWNCWCEVFGAEVGAHARSAFGVAQIPMGACVEIELIAELRESLSSERAAAAASPRRQLRRRGRGAADAACLRHAALPLVRAAAADIRRHRLRGLLGLVWRSALGQRRRCAAAVGAVQPPASPRRCGSTSWPPSSSSCNLTLADRIVAGLRLDALLPEVFQATATAPMPQSTCWACPTSSGAWRCSA